jgi:hypothetical protein
MGRRYSKTQVQELRDKRKFSKPKKEGISQEAWDRKLGRLLAAGHLRINGFSSMNMQRESMSNDYGVFGNVMPNVDKALITQTIEFRTLKENAEYGDKPHLTGYLESASNADKHPYRIKGWFNPDGTIRIELVD